MLTKETISINLLINDFWRKFLRYTMLLGFLFSVLIKGFSQEGSSPYFQITANGVAVANGSVLYLANYDQIVLISKVINAGACDKATFTMTFSWSDPHNTRGIAPVSFSGTATSFEAESILSDVGGNVTVTYNLNNGPTQVITFRLLGSNPGSQATVKSWSLGPWYSLQVLEQESTLRQFASDNTPLVSANPDGVGIAQLDGQRGPVTLTIGDYFGWHKNIGDAQTVFNLNKATATTFWNSQVAQATSAHPPPGPQTVGYCTLGSSSQTWLDADSIALYNGTGSVTATCPAGGSSELYTAGYYISWSGTNATNGQWQFKTEPSGCFVGRSYVGDVCNQLP